MPKSCLQYHHKYHPMSPCEAGKLRRSAFQAAVPCAVQAKAFQGVPVLALTATATDKVKDDVTKILRISGCPVFNVSPHLPHDMIFSLKSAISWKLQSSLVSGLAKAMCVGH